MCVLLVLLRRPIPSGDKLNTSPRPIASVGLEANKVELEWKVVAVAATHGSDRILGAARGKSSA